MKHPITGKEGPDVPPYSILVRRGGRLVGRWARPSEAELDAIWEDLGLWVDVDRDRKYYERRNKQQEAAEARQATSALEPKCDGF
jgi:hypothetical protein